MNALYSLCAAGLSGYLVDAIVVVIMLFFIFSCAKRGFINCFFGFISTIAALFLAISLAQITVTVTGGLFGVQNALETSFVTSFSSLAGFDIDVSGQDLSLLLQEKDLPAILITLALKNNGGNIPAGSTLGMIVGESVAWLATVLIAGIILYILVRLFLRILRTLFNSISDSIGLIGFVNRLLGSLVGFVEVILLASLVISFITLIPSQNVIDFFQSSLILRALYNHNPIVTIISWFL